MPHPCPSDRRIDDPRRPERRIDHPHQTDRGSTTFGSLGIVEMKCGRRCERKDSGSPGRVERAGGLRPARTPGVPVVPGSRISDRVDNRGMRDGGGGLEGEGEGRRWGGGGRGAAGRSR